jgi:hypothetical protein
MDYLILHVTIVLQLSQAPYDFLMFGKAVFFLSREDQLLVGRHLKNSAP